jgi:hypothetical protein
MNKKQAEVAARRERLIDVLARRGCSTIAFIQFQMHSDPPQAVERDIRELTKQGRLRMFKVNDMHTVGGRRVKRTKNLVHLTQKEWENRR